MFIMRGSGSLRKLYMKYGQNLYFAYILTKQYKTIYAEFPCFTLTVQYVLVLYAVDFSG